MRVVRTATWCTGLHVHIVLSAHWQRGVEIQSQHADAGESSGSPPHVSVETDDDDDVAEMEDIPNEHRKDSNVTTDEQSISAKMADNLKDPRERPHVHSVSQPYGNADVQPPVQRFPVSAHQLSWATEFPEFVAHTCF